MYGTRKEPTDVCDGFELLLPTSEVLRTGSLTK